MANNSDTGHAVNVANFNDLISFATGYGEAYNPSNNAIKLPALQEMAAVATGAQGAYTATVPAYKNAIAAREIAFSALSGLVTRAMNILKASGAPKQVYDQANTVARKIKGIRASTIIKAEPTVEGAEPAPAVKQISSSQMGYDSRIENFGILIQLLAGIPEYTPNENELKTETLSEVQNDLKAKNNAFIVAEVPHSNARIARNEVFYTKTTGLVDIAQTVKNYVKAIFGATSPQYKQISKLKFTRQR